MFWVVPFLIFFCVLAVSFFLWSFLQDNTLYAADNSSGIGDIMHGIYVMLVIIIGLVLSVFAYKYVCDNAQQVEILGVYSVISVSNDSIVYDCDGTEKVLHSALHSVKVYEDADTRKMMIVREKWFVFERKAYLIYLSRNSVLRNS